MHETGSVAAQVNRYLALVAAKDAEGLAELFVSAGTVEDPVGSPVHTGRDEVRHFYQAALGTARTVDVGLKALRVCGLEAVFHFWVTLDLGDKRVQYEPIDVMTFDESKNIVSMRAYWSESDVTEVRVDR